MTFSIVARSADGESWGVAVASKFLAVGATVPAAVAGVGAVATQADANVAYKGLALAHLDEGATAPVAVQRLLEEDEGRHHRQVGIVDIDGGAASHTGQECIPWAGGTTRRRLRHPGQLPDRRRGRRRDGGGLARQRHRGPARRPDARRPRRRRRRRRRQAWPAVRGDPGGKEGAGYGGARRRRRRPPGRRPRHADRRARSAARPQRPLPHRVHRGGEGHRRRRAARGARGVRGHRRAPRLPGLGRQRRDSPARLRVRPRTSGPGSTRESSGVVLGVSDS